MWCTILCADVLSSSELAVDGQTGHCDTKRQHIDRGGVEQVRDMQQQLTTFKREDALVDAVCAVDDC